MAAVLFAAPALAACQLDVDVAIDVGGDGHGQVIASVSLDGEASKIAGDLRREVRTDDLERAGWMVDVRNASVTATRRFTTTSEANAALDALSGPDGPLGSLTIDQDRDLERTQTRVDGAVDLRRGAAAFGDARIESLTGSPVGGDVAALGRAIRMRVRIDLPGRDVVEITPPMGSRTPVDVSATSWQVARTSGAIGAAIAVLVVVRAARAPRTRRVRRP